MDRPKFEPAFPDLIPSTVPTECFGFHTNNGTVRALDWHKKYRSDKSVVANLASHLERGALTRQERFGEIGGRILSGMFRERQDGLHVKTHTDMAVDGLFLHGEPQKQWRQLFEWFSDKTQFRNRVFLLIDAPQVVLYSHKPDRHKTVIPQSVPVTDRVIKAIFYRSSICSEVDTQIASLAKEYALPLIDIDSL